MKKRSKEESRKAIEACFDKETLDPQAVKKIKKIAMSHGIKLGKYRARFCKKCYADLKRAKQRVSLKSIIRTCPACGFMNRVSFRTLPGSA